LSESVVQPLLVLKEFQYQFKTIAKKEVLEGQDSGGWRNRIRGLFGNVKYKLWKKSIELGLDNGLEEQLFRYKAQETLDFSMTLLLQCVFFFKKN